MAQRHLPAVKTRVVRNGFRWSPLVSNRSLGDRISVACPSLPRPWKGHDLLLRAVCDDPSNIPPYDIHLWGVIDGDGPYVSELKQLAKAVKDPAKVFLHPRTSDLTEFLAREVDIVVVPSTSPDPFPTVVIEAGCLGVKVVGAAIGGIPEILGDFTTLFPPGSSPALRRALDVAVQQLRLGDFDRSSQVRFARARYSFESYQSTFIAALHEEGSSKC